MGKPTEDPAYRLPEPEELDHATQVLQLLADRTRLGILSILLGTDEQSVGEIARILDRPVPGVSQHLTKLKHGRLVSSRRDGTTIYYRISGEHVTSLLVDLLHHTEHELFDEPPHHRRSARPAHGTDA